MPDLLSVAPGVPFKVELGSAPGSTGYEWQPEVLPEGVRLLGSTFSLPAGAAVGDGGVQSFQLVADRTGRFRLHFVLKRRWESEAMQRREFELESR
jgi:predicted secreted protein